MRTLLCHTSFVWDYMWRVCVCVGVVCVCVCAGTFFTGTLKLSLWSQAVLCHSRWVISPGGLSPPSLRLFLHLCVCDECFSAQKPHLNHTARWKAVRNSVIHRQDGENDEGKWDVAFLFLVLFPSCFSLIVSLQRVTHELKQWINLSHYFFSFLLLVLSYLSPFPSLSVSLIWLL